MFASGVADWCTVDGTDFPYGRRARLSSELSVYCCACRNVADWFQESRRAPMQENNEIPCGTQRYSSYFLDALADG